MKCTIVLIVILSTPFFLVARKSYHVPVRQSQIGALNLAIQTTHHRVVELHEKFDAHTATFSSGTPVIEESSAIGQSISQVDIPYTIDQPGAYYLNESITTPSDQTAITIASDNVVLDLQGHSISGVVQSNEGLKAVISGGGIVIENVTDLTIQNGTIQTMDQSGIRIMNSSHIRLYSILSRSNNQHGIVIENGNVIEIARTYATHNGLDGFNTAADHVTYNACFAIENFGTGFSHSGINLTLTSCQAHTNSMNGFICTNSTNIHLIGCKAHKNSLQGLGLVNSSEFHLEQSLFMNNGSHGLSMETSQNGSLSHCTIKKNQQHGIYSITTDSVSIRRSHIINNLFDGIHGASGQYWTMKENGVQNNTQSGVRFLGTHSVIEGNTIAHNGIGAVDEYGIDIGLDPTTNEIFSNRAKHNGVSPGLPVATDTNYSAGVYQSPVSSPIGTQVSPGGGIGILENITTT